MLVTELLDRIVEIFKRYTSEISDAAIKQNFTVVYEVSCKYVLICVVVG